MTVHQVIRVAPGVVVKLSLNVTSSAQLAKIKPRLVMTTEAALEAHEAALVAEVSR